MSWWRFGIVGGLVTGFFVPAFISFMRFISGEAPLSFESLFRNGMVGLVFGAAAAAASLRLAQFANAPLPDPSHEFAELVDGVDFSEPAGNLEREAASPQPLDRGRR
jgi:hypothetical protein